MLVLKFLCVQIGPFHSHVSCENVVSLIPVKFWLHFLCLQEVLSSLDVGLADSLKEVTAKSLKKIANQQAPLYEEIDDSLVT